MVLFIKQYSTSPFLLSIDGVYVKFFKRFENTKEIH